MKAEELDQLFDEGEDITPYLDLSTLKRPAYQQKRSASVFQNGSYIRLIEKLKKSA